jgi:uncharacterized membrane protein (DUF441 family)
LYIFRWTNEQSAKNIISLFISSALLLLLNKIPLGSSISSISSNGPNHGASRIRILAIGIFSSAAVLTYETLPMNNPVMDDNNIITMAAAATTTATGTAAGLEHISSISS